MRRAGGISRVSAQDHAGHSSALCSSSTDRANALIARCDGRFDLPDHQRTGRLPIPGDLPPPFPAHDLRRDVGVWLRTPDGREVSMKAGSRSPGQILSKAILR